MKTYTLTLTHEQVDLILLALADKPLKEVLSTFQGIHQQCAEQSQPAEPPTGGPVKPDDSPLPPEEPDDPV